MKKFLILAASAAVLLTGCQKNEMAVQNMEGQQEISFQTYSGREVTKAALNSGSFKVTAYKQDNSVESLYYSNVTYTWNPTSSCFASDPAKYWPSTGKLDFYAVMPTSLTADKKVKFTADGTTDFSAAYLAAQTSAGNPKLSFGHKLTKVAFKAVGADTHLMYEITGITLTAKDTATFDISAGTWGSNGTKTNTYTVLSAKDTIKAGTSAAKSVGSTLYLLPSNAASLNVKYNVYENGQKIDDGAATSGITVDLSSTSASWAVNSSYLYTLTLNLTSSAKPVTFTATTTDWDTTKDTTINVVPAGPVAKIGDTEYTSLQAAFDAAGSSETSVELLRDVTFTNTLTLAAGKNVKLLPGESNYKISCTSDSIYILGTLNLQEFIS